MKIWRALFGRDKEETREKREKDEALAARVRDLV